MRIQSKTKYECTFVNNETRWKKKTSSPVLIPKQEGPSVAVDENNNKCQVMRNRWEPARGDLSLSLSLCGRWICWWQRPTWSDSQHVAAYALHAPLFRPPKSPPMKLERGVSNKRWSSFRRCIFIFISLFFTQLLLKVTNAMTSDCNCHSLLKNFFFIHAKYGAMSLFMTSQRK